MILHMLYCRPWCGNVWCMSLKYTTKNTNDCELQYMSHFWVKSPSPQAVSVQPQLLIFREGKITILACSHTNKVHLFGCSSSCGCLGLGESMIDLLTSKWVSWAQTSFRNKILCTDVEDNTTYNGPCALITAEHSGCIINAPAPHFYQSLVWANSPL